MAVLLGAPKCPECGGRRWQSDIGTIFKCESCNYRIETKPERRSISDVVESTQEDAPRCKNLIVLKLGNDGSIIGDWDGYLAANDMAMAALYLQSYAAKLMEAWTESRPR